MTPLQKLISETPSSKVSAAEIGFHVGAASRDAEVAELINDVKLLREDLEFLLTCKHGEFCAHYSEAERRAKKTLSATKHHDRS